MSVATIDINSVLQAVLSLPRPERAYLAERLILSLDDDEDIEISQAWRDELDRRVESRRNGTSPSIPHEEVKAQLRAICEAP